MLFGLRYPAPVGSQASDGPAPVDDGVEWWSARVVWVALGTAAIVGLVLRIWIFMSPFGHMDADEAVWGLMAKHVLSGEIPALFWGENYGGTLEVILTAPIYALLGPRKITVELVPMLFNLASVYLVWRIAKRLLGERGGVVAAAIYWVWPGYVVWKAMKAHGFYGSGIAFSLLAILFAFRLFEKVTVRDSFILGVAAGVAWWTSPQVILILVPLAVWLLLRRPAVLKQIHVVIGGFALGTFPWLVHNVTNNWRSITETLATPHGDYSDHLTGAIRNGIPAILGLRAPWTQQWVLTPWLGRAVYVLVLAGLLVLAYRVVFVRTERTGKQLLVLIALAYPFIFSWSSQAWHVNEPRYFFLLAPIVVILAVSAIRKWTPQLFVTAVCVAVLSSTAGLSFAGAGNATFGMAPNVPLGEDISPLIEALDDNGVLHIYANYWIAYRVVYETDERIIAYPEEGKIRIPEHAAEVAADPAAAHVFLIGSSSGPPYTSALDASGVPYSRVEAGPFVIYIPHPV